MDKRSVLYGIAYELGEEFAQKEYEKRMTGTEKVVRKYVSAWLCFFGECALTWIPTIFAFSLCEPKGGAQYWCVPLLLLLILLGLFTAYIFAPIPDFTGYEPNVENEVLRSMKNELDNGYFTKRKYWKKYFGYCFMLGLCYGLIMLLGVLSWDGKFEPYLGEFVNSMIAIFSFGLPVMAFFGVFGLKP